jgi:hypothetical protein
MNGNGYARIRLFEQDLTPMECKIHFKNKEHVIHLQITAFGEVASQATEFVSLLTEHPIPPAGDHYKKLVGRCKELEHKNKFLRDNIEVCHDRYIDMHAS